MARKLRTWVFMSSFLAYKLLLCCGKESCPAPPDGTEKYDCSSSEKAYYEPPTLWIYISQALGSAVIICVLTASIYKLLSFIFAKYTERMKSTKVFDKSIIYDDPPRAVLGCLQIATDYVLDSEGPALIRHFPGVEYRSQKIRLEGECTTAENFESSARNVTDAVCALQPPDRCTVIGISCTSMSFTLGADTVDKLLKTAVPGFKVTDMARGQAAAIQVLGARRVALFTPYIESVSLANVAMLEKCAGVEVISRLTMGLERDEQSSLVSLESIREWAKAVDVEEAELVVIGCSALRACPPNGFIDKLEEQLGKPVVTSTQAFLWIMLRTAGVKEQITGYGRLFREH